ncbi:MAG: hypothetical protein IPK07_19215 [Deltaproteobacteria bacterium]|jgi:hypothetical protein|nr:hypothetical protein [Deltaproteobacteria bacterium]
MSAQPRSTRVRLLLPALVFGVVSVAAAQEVEQRRIIHTRVVHATIATSARNLHVDPSVGLISTKLTSKLPYREYTLLQEVRQALGVDEIGSIMLPAHGGSVEVKPTAFLDNRTRMRVKVLPAASDVRSKPVELNAETSAKGTVVIGGVPHRDGTLLILIQQQQAPAQGSPASKLFGESPQY